MKIKRLEANKTVQVVIMGIRDDGSANGYSWSNVVFIIFALLLELRWRKFPAASFTSFK